jgi:hypothetical protein
MGHDVIGDLVERLVVAEGVGAHAGQGVVRGKPVLFGEDADGQTDERHAEAVGVHDGLRLPDPPDPPEAAGSWDPGRGSGPRDAVGEQRNPCPPHRLSEW